MVTLYFAASRWQSQASNPGRPRPALHHRAALSMDKGLAQSGGREWGGTYGPRSWHP